MDIELTHEQIAKLTPEQVTMLEEDPSRATEILAGQEAATEGTPKQEEQDGVTNDAGDEEEPVVLNKSGKGVIPYSTVKDLRVDNATLKERVEMLEATRIELEELKAQRVTVKTPARFAELQEKVTNHIAVMKEDFPDIGDSLDAVNGLITELNSELEAMKDKDAKREEAVKVAKVQTVEQQVAEAKENNPDLIHWEKNDPEAWDEALRQDEGLRQTPVWAAKTFEERFDEVVRRVRILMPDATKPKETNPEARKAAVKAKLETAPARKPTTLSDIQGGANPASEREQLENLNPFDLAQKLMKMPKQAAEALRADLD